MKIDSRNVKGIPNLPAEAYFKLSRLLTSMFKGSDNVIVSPIAYEVEPEDILSGWDKIFGQNKDLMNDVLLNLEDENRSKYGPRSIAVPWLEREPGVREHFSADMGKVIETRKPASGRLSPLFFIRAVEFLKLQTSAGLPFMNSKASDLAYTIENISSLLSEEYPAVAFTRTQDKKKTRLVWCPPLAMILDEMRFYRPILEYQRTMPWRAALSKPEIIDEAISKLINHAISKGLNLVSIDFTAYDSKVKKTLQNYAFRVYFPSLFQRAYHSELQSQGDRFCNIPLITPFEVLRGDHGIPSGSAYTNEVGSVVQYGISEDFKEDLSFSQTQGDDGAYAVDDVLSFFEHFNSYGLQINDEKSYVAKNYLIYLQNLYHIDYVKDGLISGIYPTYRALARIVYQERFNDISEDDISGKDYFAIRSLSILENCKHHPLFRELVTYVYYLDKYNLDFSDQGLDAYVRRRMKQDGKDISFTEYRPGDALGIKSFEAYKIVKELNG